MTDQPRPAWIVIEADDLLAMLRRCHAGEPPDLVLLESYANADIADVSTTSRCAQYLPIAIELVLVLIAAFVVWALLKP